MPDGVCDVCDRCYYLPDVESYPARTCPRCSRPLRPLSLEERRAFVLDRLIRARPPSACRDLEIQCRRARLLWAHLKQQQKSRDRREESPAVRGKAGSCLC